MGMTLGAADAPSRRLTVTAHRALLRGTRTPRRRRLAGQPSTPCFL